MRNLLYLLLLIIPYQLTAQTWQWGVSNNYGYPGSVESGFVTVDHDGNVFTGGNFFSTGSSISFGTYTVTGASTALFVSKYDSSGNIIWVTTIPGPPSMMSLRTDAHGNVYVLGQFTSATLTVGSSVLLNTVGYIMDFVAKISASGTILWAHNIAPSAMYGSLSGEIGFDASGHMYVIGSYNIDSVIIGASTIHNTTTTMGDSADIFVVKYDTSGNVIWAKSFGGHENETATSITVGQSGDYYLSGLIGSPTMTIGSITLVDSLYGTSRNSSFMARFDSSGNPIWARTMNQHIDLWDIVSDASKNIYVAGDIDNNVVLGHDTLSGPGMLVVKFDSTGGIKWANSATGYHVKAEGIAIDANHNVFVSGQTSEPINFNGIIVDTPATGFRFPGFIAGFDHCGNYIIGSGHQIGNIDGVRELQLDGAGNLYLAGEYTDVMDVFGPDTLLAPPLTGQEYLFLAKYKCGPLPIDDGTPCDTPVSPLFVLGCDRVVGQVNIFPNPANDHITISAVESVDQIIICNLTGDIVYRKNNCSQKTEIDITGFPGGVYLIKVNNADFQKFIKL